MNLTVHIPDEAVPALRAKASGVPLEAFAERVLLERIHEEGTHASGADETRPAHRRFDNLSDLLLNSPFAGANLDLARSKDQPRPVAFG